MKDDKIVGTPVYNVLHNENDNIDESHDVIDVDDDIDIDHHSHKRKHGFKGETVESLDFLDVESMMWRKV